MKEKEVKVVIEKIYKNRIKELSNGTELRRQLQTLKESGKKDWDTLWKVQGLETKIEVTNRGKIGN